MDHIFFPHIDQMMPLLLKTPEWSEVLPEWFNFSFLAGLLIGSFMTWLGSRARQEQVRIVAEVEKREITRELSELEKTKIALEEENQVLDRMQGVYLSKNSDLENEINNLKAHYANKEELYKQTEGRLNQFIDALQQSSPHLLAATPALIETSVEEPEAPTEDPTIDLEPATDTLITPPVAVPVVTNETDSALSVVHPNAIDLNELQRLKEHIFTDKQSLLQEKNQIANSVQNRFLSTNATAEGVIESEFMRTSPEEPETFKGFIEKQGFDSFCQFFIEEPVIDEFPAIFEGKPMVEVLISLSEELHLNVNFALWRQFRAYDQFALGESECQIIANFAEAIIKAAQQSELGFLILMPQDRRLNQLIFSELEEANFPFEEFLFANLMGLLRFMNAMDLVGKNGELAEMLTTIEQRLNKLEEIATMSES